MYVDTQTFHHQSHSLHFTLLDFWRWSSSDLISNATRGILAEYIVAQALGVAEESRKEWTPYDLLTPEGIRVEVKSAAYIQSWEQKRPSRIVFQIPPTRGWDEETGTYSTTVKRQADVYVFALLGHKERETLDPLDISQWEFYVVTTGQLPRQNSIRLAAIQSLAGSKVPFTELRKAIVRAANVQSND